MLPRHQQKHHVAYLCRLATSCGGIKGQYSYSPYGEQTKIAGTGPDADFGFAGMYVHQRSGLNLTMFRAYNPALGRWLGRDPMGEAMGTNLYAYVGNNPLRFIDPLGLSEADAAMLEQVSRGEINAMTAAGQRIAPGWLNNMKYTQSPSQVSLAERDLS